MEEKPTYPANRDARAQLTEIESATSRRVHRLDRICGNKPAKLLNFKSLTLRSGSSRFGPVYLYFSGVWWCEGDFAPAIALGSHGLRASPKRQSQSTIRKASRPVALER